MKKNDDQYNTTQFTHGRWWWESGNGKPGLLQQFANGRALLDLHGTFAGFESYEQGGRGAKLKRSVIRGTTANGRRLSLIDCIEWSHGAFGKRKRSKYAASWCIEGAHFKTYDSLTFTSISFECERANDIIGPSSFRHRFRNGGLNASYRQPPHVVAYSGSSKLSWFSGRRPLTMSGQLLSSVPNNRLTSILFG
jgi:hypothetical protein